MPLPISDIANIKFEKSTSQNTVARWNQLLYGMQERITKNNASGYQRIFREIILISTEEHYPPNLLQVPSPHLSNHKVQAIKLLPRRGPSLPNLRELPVPLPAQHLMIKKKMTHLWIKVAFPRDSRGL